MTTHGWQCWRTLAALVAIFLGAGLVAAQEPEEEEEGGIRDNSFFIEEAYNQEPGVVQHITNFVRFWDDDQGRTRNTSFVFTQEWPVFSQTHQFSYTLPFEKYFEQPDGGAAVDENGFGDMLLNYRYQLRDGEDGGWAVSPRFSFILPTGNEDRGLGSGELGYQFNLPMSREVGDYAFHFNAGMTYTPGVHLNLPGGPTPNRRLLGYNLGVSTIYIGNKKVQPMLECVAYWDEELDDVGDEERTTEVLLSPGVRWAPYTQDSTQIVLGVAAPIGLTSSSPDIGVFGYLSIEHALPRWFRGCGCRDCEMPCCE